MQSHCKPRGNPRADDWMFFFLFYLQVVTMWPNFSNFTVLCATIFMVLTHFCAFSFFLFCLRTPLPFQLSLLCGSSPLLPQSDPTFVLFGSTQKLLKARVQRKSQRRKATQGYAFAGLSPVFSSYQDLFYNVNVL